MSFEWSACRSSFYAHTHSSTNVSTYARRLTYMAGWLRSVRSIEAADEAERGSLMRARASKISTALPTASAMWRIQPCIPVWFSSFLFAHPSHPFDQFAVSDTPLCWMRVLTFSKFLNVGSIVVCFCNFLLHKVKHWLVCQRKAFFSVSDESKHSLRNESKNNYIEWKKQRSNK